MSNFAHPPIYFIDNYAKMRPYGFLAKSIITCLIASSMLSSCDEIIDDVPPIPKISLFPTHGDTSTYFCFDGSGSTDNRSEIWQLKFQWDLNGDGMWDTELTTNPKFVWKFQKFGRSIINLQVVDNAGLTNHTSYTVEIAPNFNDTTFIDSRDGNPYRAVRIDQTWWMAENLNYGQEILVGFEPADNGIAEKFLYRDSMNRLINKSAYYNWNEITYYGKDIVNGICPEGWRITNWDDVYNLHKRFFYYGDAAFYLKPGGYVGIDFTLDGYYSFFDRKFFEFNRVGFEWISQKNNSETKFEHYVFEFDHSYGLEIWYSIPHDDRSYPWWWNTNQWGLKVNFNKFGFNVRCVKDNAKNGI